MSTDEVVIEHERFGRALDFESHAPVETRTQQPSSMDLDFEEVV